MRTKSVYALAIVCLLSTMPAQAARPGPAGSTRLTNVTAPLAGPPSWNKGEAQGGVIQTYLSGSFGAFEVALPDGTYARFECGNESSRLGCAALSYGDTVKVNYRLAGILAPYCGPWDGIINTSIVVWLYRWTGSTWQLLTTP